MEFSHPPLLSCLTCIYIFSLFKVSVSLCTPSDFVASVPKGLMLYGSVRELHHHSSF